MQVLSLLQSVLPEGRAIAASRLRRPWLALRHRALSALRDLLQHLLRRVARLLSRHAPQPQTSTLALRGSVTTIADTAPPPPTAGLVGSFLARVQSARSEQERSAALAGTLGELERAITLLRSIDAPIDATGLERSYQQIQRLADPYGECTGFELNMAWLLLERELGALARALDRC